MSKPVFEDLFTASGRRNRQSYFLLYLVYLTASLIGLSLMSAASDSPGVLIAGLCIVLPASISAILTSAQRCRDFGWSGWAVLFSLIPFVGCIFSIALFFIPGTAGPNRYGEDPTSNRGVSGLPA